MLRKGYLSFVLFLFDDEFLDFFGVQELLSMQNGNGILVTGNQDVETKIDIKLLDPGECDMGYLIVVETQVL
jgi:hypothetical protein